MSDPSDNEVKKMTSDEAISVLADYADCSSDKVAEAIDVLHKLADAADKSICVWCGYIGPKQAEAMLDHAMGCKKHPVSKLALAKEMIEQAESERDEARRLLTAFLWAIDDGSRAEYMRALSATREAVARWKK